MLLRGTSLWGEILEVGELAEMGFSPSPHPYPYPTLVSFKNKSRAPSAVSALLHPLRQSAAEGEAHSIRKVTWSLVPKKPRGPSSPADTFVWYSWDFLFTCLANGTDHRVKHHSGNQTASLCAGGTEGTMILCVVFVCLCRFGDQSPKSLPYRKRK